MKIFSDLTGYQFEWLLKLKDTLNSRLQQRNQRLTRLREKRDSTYLKLLFKQTHYSEETETARKEILEEQIKRLRKRLTDTRYEISRVPCRPTHAEVAELLDIPKGTIDSGLHYFRKKYKSSIDINSYSLIL
jgi:DNA-directed RNA polymerase specialized sigma24 family protein